MMNSIPTSAAVPTVTPAAVHSLRPATPADVPVIVSLIRELAEFEQLLHWVVVTPESLLPQLFGPRPGAECWVAEVADAAEEAEESATAGSPAGSEAAGAPAAQRVVGFALFFHNFSTFLGRPGLYLEDLYVQPAHRGSGIGQALLRRLAALAVERGCGRFEWSVLDWNNNAIGFYQRMGATVMPDWRICRVTGPALQALAQLDGER